MKKKPVYTAKPLIGEEEIQAVSKVLKSGMLAQGEVVSKFEKNFQKYQKVKHAVAVNSGTSALHLALLAFGIGEDDEVITSPFSFIASATSIMMTGAIPIFSDITEDDFGLDPDLLESKITKKTKAIIPVHLYGQACRIEEIKRIAKKHDLVLIEDACQAHGAKYQGKGLGSFGDAGTFSFYPTKNMTTGEGGIVSVKRADIAEKLKLLRNHGQNTRYYSEILGYNYRMTNIEAAIGIAQLKKLTQFNKKRVSNARYLSSLLKNKKGIITPKTFENRNHVFHQYTIRVTEEYPLTRQELINRLLEEDIGSSVFYPLLIPDQKPVKARWPRLGQNLPVAKQMRDEVLSLPIHPGVSKKDLDRIAKLI